MLLIPVVLMLFLLLEAFRREVFQLLLIHITCSEVRALALGENKNIIENENRNFLMSALGSVLGEQIERESKRSLKRVTEPIELRWLKVGKFPGGLSERWLRYEQLLSFELRSQKKHHQEIIKRCLFPFS